MYDNILDKLIRQKGGNVLAKMLWSRFGRLTSTNFQDRISEMELVYSFNMKNRMADPLWNK